MTNRAEQKRLRARGDTYLEYLRAVGQQRVRAERWKLRLARALGDCCDMAAFYFVRHVEAAFRLTRLGGVNAAAYIRFYSSCAEDSVPQILQPNDVEALTLYLVL